MIAPNPCEESDDDGGPYPSVLFDVLSDLKEGIRDNGPLHPKVGDLWNSLGLIRLHMQRKIDAAVKCHEQAIKIYRANGSDKTTQTQMAACLSDLAACYEQQGDFEGALRLYEEALQILDSPEGESCPSFHRQSIERSLARIRRSWATLATN